MTGLIKINVGNGGMSVNLVEPKPTITKRDGGVFLNGTPVPFANPNDWSEGEATPDQVKRMILRATRMVEMKKEDATYANH